MKGVLIASEIKREYNICIPPQGKRCYVLINDMPPVEMVYEAIKGKPGGIRWFFICPITGKRCRKLYIINGAYGLKKFERPAWHTGTLIDGLLKIMERRLRAERSLEGKAYRTHYKGKETKRFLKIKAGLDISMFDLINGKYDYLLQRKE